MDKFQEIFNTKKPITKEIFACAAEEIICYCNYFFHKKITQCPIKKTFDKNISFCTIHKGITLYHLYYNEISSVGDVNIKKTLIGKYPIKALLRMAKFCSKFQY